MQVDNCSLIYLFQYQFQQTMFHKSNANPTSMHLANVLLSFGTSTYAADYQSQRRMILSICIAFPNEPSQWRSMAKFFNPLIHYQSANLLPIQCQSNANASGRCILLQGTSYLLVPIIGLVGGWFHSDPNNHNISQSWTISAHPPKIYHCKSSNNLTISCHFITANSVPIRQSFTYTMPIHYQYIWPLCQ